MEIVYATGPDAPHAVRHIARNETETLCGLPAGGPEELALPVNCDGCRTENGRLIRARREAPQSGYTPCACRDCMDVTVSSDTSNPELCTECKDAGCTNADSLPGYMTAAGIGGVEYECQRADAYEG